MSDAGVAFVQLVPSMRGASRKITQELGRGLAAPLKRAGKQAGDDLGSGIGDGVGKSSGGLKTAVGRLGEIVKTGMKAAGLAAGALLVVGLSTAFEQEAATDKLQAQLGGSEWAAEMGQVAGNLYSDAFGESVAETGEAVRAVVQSPLVADDASAKEIEDITALALTFGDVMDKDVAESVRTVSTLLRTGMARDAEHGFDLLTRGIQQGVDVGDDLLETVNEYSTQFRALGLEGPEALGLMSQALQAGARDGDTAADALKEFAIRAQDGSESSRDAFGALGIDAETAFLSVAAGGDSARLALQFTLEELKNMEDPVARNAAAVALFGTKAEDLGEALFAMDLGTAAAMMGEVDGAATDLGSAYDNAATRIETFKRRALQKLVDFLGNKVIPLFEEFGPQMIEAFAPLGPALAELGPVIADALTQAGPLLADLVANAVPVIEVISDLISKFAEADPQTQKMILGAAGLAAAMGPIINIVTGVAGAIGGAARGLITFGQGMVSAGRFAFRMATFVGRGALAFGRLALAAGRAGLAVVRAGAQMAVAAARAAARVVASIATQIARWVMLGVQSLLQAARVALAWIISMGPIGLIIAAVVGLVALIIANWDTIVAATKAAFGFVMDLIGGAIDWARSNWPLIVAILTGPIGIAVLLISRNWDKIKAGMTAVKDWIAARVADVVASFRRRFNEISAIVRTAYRALRTGITRAKDWVAQKVTDIVDFFRRLPGRLRTALSSLARALTSPFRSAFNSLKRLWNNSVGGFGFTVPDWIPGVGGKGFKIPKMHRGGIVPGPLGADVPILAQAGEGIFTRSQLAAIGPRAADSAPPPRLILSADGETFFLRWIKNMVLVEGGGDVNVAFGGRAA